MAPFLVIMGVICIFFLVVISYIVVACFIEARKSIRAEYVSIRRSEDGITQVTHG